MKKILLALAAVFMAVCSYAAVEIPQFYSENFVKMGLESDVPTDGWITYGNGAVPADGIPSDFFYLDGDLFNYIILNVGSESYVMANTIFKDNATPDEWLVSPEIEVPYDEAVLQVTAVGYAAKGALPSGTGKFKVLVSTTGTEQADFTDVVLASGSVNSSSSNEISTKQLAIALNGYKGKKIHLAFVVTSPNVGFIGFTNVKLGQYAINMTDYTKTLYKNGDSGSLDVNFGLKTPVAASSFSVRVDVDGKDVFTQTYKKNLGATASSTSLVMQRVKAENIGVIEKEKPLNYTMYVTPDFEGAIPSVVTGTLSAVENEYLNNIVLEEMTATGCTFCPRGLAALDYYHENYPGTDEVGKAIIIGIHGYVNFQDPMGNTPEIKAYLQNANVLAGGTGYPNVSFNRVKGYRGLEPANSYARFTEMIATKSFNEVKISKVETPVLAEGESLIGKTLNVTFDVRNGYSIVNRNLNAAVILIENNVKGFNSDYDQSNNFANETESSFSATYNKQFTPYAKKYLNGGELGMNPIPFSKMVYQHVLRGAYPSYYGESLTESWVANEAQTFTREFTMPENVMNPEETEVIVLVIDPETDEIVASDIKPYSEFVQVSGVKVAAAEGNVKVANENGTLKVNAAGNGVADVYSVDGAHLGSYAFNGELAVAAEWNGLVVVKVTTAAETTSAKLLF